MKTFKDLTNELEEKLNKSKIDFIEIFDIPTIVLIGAALAPACSGFLLVTFIFLIQSFFDHSWQWLILLDGVKLLGVSVLIAGIAMVYWWFVPKRLGAITPRLFGVSILLAITSFMCSGFLTLFLTHSLD